MRCAGGSVDEKVVGDSMASIVVLINTRSDLGYHEESSSAPYRLFAAKYKWYKPNNPVAEPKMMPRRAARAHDIGAISYPAGSFDV